MDLARSTATRLISLLRSRETSSVEIVTSVFASIRQREPSVRAFLTLRPAEELLAEAAAIDRRRDTGDAVGPLAGLPVAIKDNICTRGLRTTCASRILENFVPPYDATVMARIRRADGILLGKTNLDEFAMGSTTEHSAFAATRNPHDPTRVPGGTSGGSAAAVAAHETILALGSDTGGSIRQPAAFCGIVGVKPTYGRVSRYGLVAHASSFDQIGPLTKDVRDAALLLGVIAGCDPHDSTSVAAAVPDYTAALEQPRTYRVGVPFGFLGAGIDPEIRTAAERLLDTLRSAGHAIVPVELKHTEYAIPTYYILVCSEASSNLARYDGCRYGYRAPEYDDLIDMYRRTRAAGFGAEVKRRIILGTYALSAGYYEAYYSKAMKVRSLIAGDFRKAFEVCDFILHPVSPALPFALGEKLEDPLSMYLADIYTVLANLAGLPAISIPCGWSASRLPIGVQLTGAPFSEAALLAAAHALEGLVDGAAR